MESASAFSLLFLASLLLPFPVVAVAAILSLPLSLSSTFPLPFGLLRITFVSAEPCHFLLFIEYNIQTWYFRC